ncbi:MAG: hypothetical protein IKY90_00265 [Oscillospiraceae bacterium]|nr:hypothetical protein [Oscillospiraceae bacterium]
MGKKGVAVVLLSEDREVRNGVVSFVLSHDNDIGDVRLDVTMDDDFISAREKAYPGMGQDLEKFVEDELIPMRDKLTVIVEKHMQR